MLNQPGTTVPVASRLRDQLLHQYARLTCAIGYVAVVEETGNTGTGWLRNNDRVTAGLGGVNSAGHLSYSTPIFISFVQPTNATVPYVTSEVSLYTDWWGDGSLGTLIAYNEFAVEVARDSRPEHNGQASIGTRYSVSAPKIRFVEFQGSSQAISNIQFAQPWALVRSLQGVVILDDYLASASGLPVTLEVWDGSTLVFSTIVHLDSTNGFTTTVPAAVPPGTYTVRVKASHWLARAIDDVTIGINGAATISTSLINGDVDRDNEVGPGDFSRLAAAFLSAPGDSNWDANADLEGDGEVGPGDFGILSNNFLLSGD